MSTPSRSFPPAVLLAGLILMTSGAACSKDTSSTEAATPDAAVAGSAATATTDAGTAPAQQSSATTAAPTAAAGAAAAPAAAEILSPEQLPAVIARIDGVEVTREDLLARATEARASLAQRGVTPPQLTRQFLRGVIDDIVGNRLVTRDLTLKGKGASAADVEAQIQALRAQFPSEEEFDKALAARNFDRERLRRDVVESLTVQNWIRTTIVPSIEITEAAAREFFAANPERMVEPEKARGRHILIFVDAKATAEERAEKRRAIDAVRARIVGGEEFASVAQAVSEDKKSAANGGDLGWFFRGQMVPPFEAAAFSLELNKLSGVVETPFGFHLIEIQERAGPTRLTFEQVRDQIEGMLKQRALEQKVRAYIDELGAKAKVEILL